MKNEMDDVHSPEIHMHEESQAYDLTWCSQNPENPETSGNLPSIDHALYLINAVKFHISQLFHLFDEDAFLQNVHDFYQKSSTERMQTSKVWLAQFFVTLALGKTAVAAPTHNKETLAGTELFMRAMHLMPDPSSLFNECLTAIETLCAVTLFLVRADMRNSSFIYIGQALRLALVFGLHRERPTQEEWPAPLAERCRRVWWTVFILDITISSSTGTPISIRNEDVTTALPVREDSAQNAALHTHVKLSSIIAFISKSTIQLDQLRVYLSAW